MKKLLVPVLCGIVLILFFLIIKQTTVFTKIFHGIFDTPRVVSEQTDTLLGEEVIALLEKLFETQSEEKFLVFTNGNTVISEYTKFGATKASEIQLPDNIERASCEVTTGHFREKTSVSYINPVLEYEVQILGNIVIVKQKMGT